MTKSEVKNALNEAIKDYNTEIEEYIKYCDESVRDDYRKIVALTLDCFAEFRNIIAELAE